MTPEHETKPGCILPGCVLYRVNTVFVAGNSVSEDDKGVKSSVFRTCIRLTPGGPSSVLKHVKRDSQVQMHLPRLFSHG